MRIAICDYAGHAYAVQLSRELAGRGHSVRHLHFTEFQTPKGELSRHPLDPETLDITPVSLGRPFEKYSLLARRSHEIEIGRRIAACILKFSPEVVLANLPLVALGEALAACRSANTPFVLWQQDIYSRAIREALGRKLGIAGRALGFYYRRMEARALAASTAVIVIAQDFVSAIADEFGLSTSNVHVIENWAPLADISVRPKSNVWALEQQLANKEVVLYSGTLGLKHDPALLLQLAEVLRSRPEAMIVVVSEGPSADTLQKTAGAMKLHNLRVLPFQPFEKYADVLGSADVLIGILQADAGRFSVPSKVLSYLCAARPIVLSAPSENLASRTLTAAGAGVAVSAGDANGFSSAVVAFLMDAERRARSGRNGRAYAERTFEIRAIADRFEGILLGAAGHAVPSRPG
jgi:glycosyltransferase involved in cell wall biosynthesis